MTISLSKMAAHLFLSQALRDGKCSRECRSHLVCPLKSGGAQDAYLDEVAMAFVYLATDETADPKR
jgi:hypothetical protein